MRDIFFKGIVNDDSSIMHGDWFYGTVIYLPSGKVHIHQKETDSSININPETVCQYTGLKDKNGKMIFEGDILRSTDASIKIPDQQVLFNDGCSCIHTYGFPEGYYAGINQKYIDDCGKIVIGNIHDKIE